MNKRHYEHTLPNIRGSLSNTYLITQIKVHGALKLAMKNIHIMLPTLKLTVQQQAKLRQAVMH